jgi:assimilatory nitrate reductase catalytic subunit
VPETRTVCGYCGVGCGVIVEHEGATITGVRGDPDHPANRGALCTKGRTLHLTASPAALRMRATRPLVRSARGAVFAPRDWESTLDLVADRFAATIREHGPDSVAFYLSGQLTTEDYYAFNKLAKGLVGTNNVDTNSRLCMSSAVAAYKRTLGADAPPGCYDDIDHADLIVIAGSNTAWAHPILFRRIEAAKARNPALKIVVVDPRRTATAACADLHLAIEPGTDVALFHGILHLLLWDGRVDDAFVAAHTSGFAELKAIVREFTPAHVATLCGITVGELEAVARWFGEARAVLSFYCQGLNQSRAGTAKNAALINLHLATGQIGRVGAGPFSLTGQPNAMGGREVGGMATLASAHRDLASAEDRAEIAALWDVDDVPAKPGLPAVELFNALADGRVKAVWIVCTNPAQSMPDAAAVRAALGQAELVVLQEIATDTETAAHADVLLPAAGWGEKEGTMTNSERRISRVRAAVPAPGEARADWAIAADVGRRLELRIDPRRRAARGTLFPWTRASQVFDEHVRTTLGRDLDIGGLSHAMLDAIGPQQWPFPAGATAGRARLYEDRVFATPDGRARFAADRHVPVAEAPDARHPFRLNTGRLRDQWHGMSRTGTVPSLAEHAPAATVELHPADLVRRGFIEGELLRIVSRRGDAVLPVVASDELKPGHAFIAMHWGGNALPGRAGLGVNALTHPATCPSSHQPELKHAAVRIEKAGLPYRTAAFAGTDDPLALRATLRALAAGLPYASVALIAGAHPGVVLDLASDQPLEAGVVNAIDAALGLDGTDVARYDDAARGMARRLRFDGGRLAAVRLAGDLAPVAWLRDWLAAGRDVAALRSRLLVAGAQPPDGSRAKRAVVCTCYGVDEEAIRACAAQGDGTLDEALARVATELRCGTSCGSCRPELRRLLSTARVTAT